jgi:hypothetical protein
MGFAKTGAMREWRGARSNATLQEPGRSEQTIRVREVFRYRIDSPPRPRERGKILSVLTTIVR